MATRTLLDVFLRESPQIVAITMRLICESVVQNDGSSGPLSSGESELAAVVKAVTEGLGLQSTLNDFDKSDATAAIGMVHRLGSGKVRHLAVGDHGISITFVQGKICISNMSGLENLSDAQPKYLGAEPCCAVRKRVFGYLSMQGCDRSQKSDDKAYSAENKM